MHGWTWAALGVLLVLAGCSSEPPASTEATATSPAGWVVTASERQDLRVTLPAWLAVFDKSGAIFANEVLPGDGPGLQLMAEGPRTAEPQPGPAEDLGIWLQRKVGAPGQGEAVLRSLDLPIGRALMLERIDRAGTASARHIDAYAVATRFGVAFLLIDGPPDSWNGREDDARLIPRLLEVGPGIDR